jgi:hypothetical protein
MPVALTHKQKEKLDSVPKKVLGVSNPVFDWDEWFVQNVHPAIPSIQHEYSVREYILDLHPVPVPLDSASSQLVNVHESVASPFEPDPLHGVVDLVPG